MLYRQSQRVTWAVACSYLLRVYKRKRYTDRSGLSGETHSAARYASELGGMRALDPLLLHKVNDFKCPYRSPDSLGPFNPRFCTCLSDTKELLASEGGRYFAFSSPTGTSTGNDCLEGANCSERPSLALSTLPFPLGK